MGTRQEDLLRRLAEAGILPDAMPNVSMAPTEEERFQAWSAQAMGHDPERGSIGPAPFSLAALLPQGLRDAFRDGPIASAFDFAKGIRPGDVDPTGFGAAKAALPLLTGAVRAADSAAPGLLSAFRDGPVGSAFNRMRGQRPGDVDLPGPGAPPPPPPPPPPPVRPREVGPAFTKAENRSARRLDGNEARVLREVERGLIPHELGILENANQGTLRNIVESYMMSPTPDAFADAILTGADARGWYDISGQGIFEAFGDDAPRFAALLAATSPQKSVAENLKVALKSWRKWNEAGRPTDPAQIERLKLVASNLHAAVPNGIRALSASAEELLNPSTPGLLSGPKVDPFWANLIGDTQRLVQDTHMSRGVGTDPGDIGTIHRGLATNATVRNALPIVERRTGTLLQPSEGQETSWSFLRGLTNAAGGSGGAGSTVDAMRAAQENPDAVLAGGQTLGQRIGDHASFGTLLNTEKMRPLLEAAGGNIPTPRETPGFFVPPEAINPRGQLDIARRIEAVRRGFPLFGTAGFLGAGAVAGSGEGGGR